MSRHCEFWLATDKNWYLELGKFEHAYEREDCSRYGPFSSFDSADQFLRRNFANPGGYTEDDTGTLPPPTDAISPHKAFGHHRTIGR